jgi:hypothetical protein
MSISTSDLWPEIWTRDLRNTKINADLPTVKFKWTQKVPKDSTHIWPQSFCSGELINSRKTQMRKNTLWYWSQCQTQLIRNFTRSLYVQHDMGYSLSCILLVCIMGWSSSLRFVKYRQNIPPVAPYRCDVRSKPVPNLRTSTYICHYKIWYVTRHTNTFCWNGKEMKTTRSLAVETFDWRTLSLHHSTDLKLNVRSAWFYF